MARLKSTQFTWLDKRPGMKHCLNNIMFYLYSRVKITVLLYKDTGL